MQCPSAKIVLLLPEDSSEPWFRTSLLSRWQRVRSWNAGSDIMRWMDETPAGDDRCGKGPRTVMKKVFVALPIRTPALFVASIAYAQRP